MSSLSSSIFSLFCFMVPGVLALGISFFHERKFFIFLVNDNYEACSKCLRLSKKAAIISFKLFVAGLLLWALLSMLT
jgi:hypothetical protein